MIIHESDYLTMYLDQSKSLSIQTWKRSPENSLVFKSEMQKFVSKYREVKPIKALWLHRNFLLVLDEETKQWTEENVINPCLEAGNSKLAFVVSKNVFSHLSIINSLEDAKLPNTPRHFTTEYEALKWLNNEKNDTVKISESEIYFHGLDENGSLLLKINTATDIADVLKLFNAIDETSNPNSGAYILFNELTDREKEILLFYLKGTQTKLIAQKSNISIHTVRTHWRNIKEKLKIKTSLEALEYRHFY
jgi:DNA-binding CsgD family transcriptional regulator